MIPLFVFLEGISVTLSLLVAYQYKDEEARRSAFRALFITGGSGIALLASLFLIAYSDGSADLAAIAGSGDALRVNALYPAMFGLVAPGALTKSAQAAAHFWLPGAMSAPSPASAYLHYAQGRHLPARSAASRARRDRPMVLGAEHHRPHHDADRGIRGIHPARLEGPARLLHSELVRRALDADRPGYRDCL